MTCFFSFLEELNECGEHINVGMTTDARIVDSWSKVHMSDRAL